MSLKMKDVELNLDIELCMNIREVVVVRCFQANLGRKLIQTFHGADVVCLS